MTNQFTKNQEEADDYERSQEYASNIPIYFSDEEIEKLNQKADANI